MPDLGVDARVAHRFGRVAIVIVNYGRVADTAECLASIRQAPDAQSLRVLLVDNGSGDSEITAVAGRWLGVTLQCLPANLGYAGGYNAGIATALQWPVDSLLLLNNDTLVSPGALQHLTQALDRWDVTVPKITYARRPNLIWAAGAGWRRFPPSVVMRGFQQPDAPAYNRAGPLDYATGCALLVKRQVFAAVGGFDTRYGSYMEDYDFCFRLRAAGFHLGYVPQAVIAHKVSQTLGENAPAKWRLLGRNTVLFYRTARRYSPADLRLYVAWVLLRETLKGQVRALPHFLAGVRQGLAVPAIDHQSELT